MSLVLASASPRRRDLLRAAGLTFDTLAVDINEAPRPGEPAASYVRRLAMEKSARASALLAERLPTAGGLAHNGTERPYVIIGADTAVVVDGEILGKPADPADAGRMLRRLSGRTHQVMTGISVRVDAAEQGCVATTVVEFLPLTDAGLSWYVASGEWQDKAGGYAIQGLASRFIPRIEGSYSNVVGLPVACLMEVFRELELGFDGPDRNVRDGFRV
jgi:septum formation protein